MKKRMISLLLCLCMLFSLLPTVVFASETETSTTVYNWDQKNACYTGTTDGNEPQLIKYNDNDPDGGLPKTLKTLYSNINAADDEAAKVAAIDNANAAGTITDNLANRLKRLVHVYTGGELASGVSLQDGSFTAKLNGDELVISGTGALPTYTRYNAAFWAPADNSVAMRPWNTEKLGDKAVSSVRFAPGITEVGAYAFYWQDRSDITSATFNRNLKLRLPDSLTKMSQATFMSLNASDIAVPSSVTTLSTRLFGKLSRLYVLGDPDIVVTSASASSFAVGSGTTVYAKKGSKLLTTSGITNMTLEEVDAIGACGTEEGYTSELVWMVQGDTLTIAAMDGGNGVMAAYTDGTSAPWNAYASQIRKIVLGAGVANISTNAFAELNSLTHVTVPNSVQIEEDAASPFGTTPLASISFSFNEGSSFANWLKKNGIDHSADVDKLGRKKLTKAEDELFHAYIGETDIAAKMTDDGTLTIYPTYSPFNNTEVPRIGGYRKDNTAFPWFDEAYDTTFDENDYKGSTKDLVNLKEIVWADGITDTGAYLFNDANNWPTGAVKFRIPDSVTKIGGALIGNKSAGTTCIIPENVTSVGFWFGGRNAENVYILNPDLTDFPVVMKGENTSPGGDSAARNIGCGFDYTVHVKKDSAAHKKLATGNYTIEPHTDMGACGAAPYSSEVFWLYDEDTRMLTIKGSGKMADYASTYAAPWAFCDVDTVTVDNGITHIGDYAFASLKKIKQENVTLGESVTVGTNAFAQPDAQGRLTLPLTPDLYYNDYIGDTTIAAKMSKDGVITIYPTDTKDTVVPEIKGYQGDNTLYPWYAVYGQPFDKNHWDGTGVHASEIKEIVFADGLTEIGGYLFNDVKGMPTSVKVRIPDSVTKVGGALVGTKNHGASIATGEKMTGVGFWYAGKATNVYILNPNMTEIPFPATVPDADLTRTIAHATGDKVAVHVKENSKAYSTLTKEGTVYTKVITHTELGACGVAPYSSETFWTYDKGSKTLTVLGDGAIRDYASANDAPWSTFDVETLVVQDGITRIGNNAFAALKNLKTVNVDGSVTEVADTAFATENGTIVDSLKKTQFLTSSVAMEEWLENHDAKVLPSFGEVGNYKWSISSDVLTIEVKDATSTDELGEKSAVISSIVTGSEPEWTAYKSIITTVKIGYGVTEIGDKVFADMPVLASVKLPSSLTKIGAEAFVNTPKLTKLYLPKKATDVAPTAFGTSSSAEKNLTIQVSPVARENQKNMQSQGNTKITVDDTKNLNVLLIGNSYFGALSGYLKNISQGLGATDAMIANYYFGGYSGNLESYVKYIKACKVSYNEETDKYSGYKENGVTNHSYNNNPLSMGIEAEDWDYVVMETWGKNEPAGVNGDGKLSQDPNLKALKEYILKYAPQAEVSLYHVYSCRYLAEREQPNETLTQQWQRYVNGADDGLAKIVTHVIPASTLIQNARLTYLNADGGDLLRNPNPTDESKRDITHLNPEGDYINAIMMYETLTGKSAAGFDHGTFDNHKEAFYHKLVDVTKAAGMKQLTYAYVKHNNTITYYDSLSAAANAAVAGDTLSLLAMPKSETPLTLKAGITVETFGSSENHTIVLTNGGNITEDGLVTFTGCKVDDADAAAKAIAVDPVTGVLREVEIELPPVEVKVYVKPYADNNPVTPAQTNTVLGTYDAAKRAFFSGTLTTRQNLSGTYNDKNLDPFKAVIGELETSGFATTDDATDTVKYPFNNIAWDTLTETEDGYEMNGTVTFYDVQFDVNGGDALNPDPSGYYLPGTVITLPTPTRTGYSFVEWEEAETSGDGGEIDWTSEILSLDDADAEAANEATYKVDGAVTLVAQWQPNKYTVSFDANGGESVSETKTLGYGSKYGNLPTTTREGYTFLGWFTEAEGGQQIGVDVKTVRIAEDHRLYAHWEAKTDVSYTVEYVRADNKMALADTKVVENQTFDSSVKESAIEITGFIPTVKEQEVKLDAYGKVITFEYTPAMYKVSFDANGGEPVSETKTLGYGSKYGNLPTTTREGYTFLGWFTEVEGGQQIGLDVKTVKIANDHKLYAHWQANTYDVVFEANGGKGEMAPQQFTYDAEQKLAKNLFTRNGYAFIGWNTEKDGSGETYTDEKAVLNLTAENGGTITLYAQWEAVSYTVAFYGNGGKLSSNPEKDKTTSPGTIGQPLTLKNADTFVREHYDFVGWATDPDATEATYTGSQKLEDGYPNAVAGETYDLYAVWTKHIYTVSINACLGGNQLGWITNMNVTVGDDLFEVANAELDRLHSFQNKSKLAIWEEGREDIRGYHADRTKIYSSKALAEFENMVFDGETKQVYINYLPNTDTPYKVEHYQEQLDSTYKLADAENLTGTTDTTATATDKGYTGFAVDETVEGTLASGTIAGDGSLVLKLYYTRNTYDVTFVSDGETINTQPVKYGATATAPNPAPTKAGYDLDGWYLNDEAFNFTTAIEGNIQLTAKWTARNDTKYTIHYYIETLDGKWEKNDSYYGRGTTDTEIDATTAHKKSYEHFTRDLSVPGTVQTGTIAGDGSLVLKLFFKRNVYDVTFVSDGATFETQHVKYGATATAPNPAPTKAGYDFDGWYLNDEAFDFTTAIEGNTQLTAKWTARSDTAYTVEHYQEQLDGTYALADTDNLTGTTDTEAVAEERSYDDFTVDKTVKGTVASGNIAGDGSLVLKLFYTRNTYDYTVRHIKQLPDGGYDEQNAKVENLSGKFEAIATVNAKDYGSHYPVNDADEKQNVQIKKGLVIEVHYDLDEHTLTFDAKGGTETDSVTVRHGNTVAKPEDPKRSGYRFTGWFDDEKCKEAHDFDAPLEEDATVYAGWRKRSTDSGVQTESPNKPKQDNSLKFNTEDHFAFVNGYPDGTVKPNGNVTRAEVAAILYRVMDADCVKTYETTRCSFSDVVRGDWFNLYVATLENAGVIVDTRTNGKFRPNEAITRAELAAMLAQFADIKSAANSFNDVSARHWASDEIAVCAKMGWINGYPDGSFRPDATITRAEMMAMINRALDRTPKSVSDLLSGMKTWSDNANTGAWYYLDVQEATNSHTYTKSGSHETWKKLR